MLLTRKLKRNGNTKLKIMCFFVMMFYTFSTFIIIANAQKEIIDNEDEITETSSIIDYEGVTPIPIAGATVAISNSILRASDYYVSQNDTNVVGCALTDYTYPTEETESIEINTEENKEEKDLFTDTDKTMYVKATSLYKRAEPNIDSDVVGSYEHAAAVHVIGETNISNWVKCEDKDGGIVYVDSSYLTNDKNEVNAEISWSGPVLDKSNGTVQGPWCKETYYNLPMQGVVSIMRSIGFDEENYPYWIDKKGAKHLGPYIMVAADLNVFPRGSIVQTSLGYGIVADTGEFIYYEGGNHWFDVATSW